MSAHGQVPRYSPHRHQTCNFRLRWIARGETHALQPLLSRLLPRTICSRVFCLRRACHSQERGTGAGCAPQRTNIAACLRDYGKTKPVARHQQMPIKPQQSNMLDPSGQHRLQMTIQMSTCPCGRAQADTFDRQRQQQLIDIQHEANVSNPKASMQLNLEQANGWSFGVGCCL